MHTNPHKPALSLISAISNSNTVWFTPASTKYGCDCEKDAIQAYKHKRCFESHKDWKYMLQDLWCASNTNALSIINSFLECTCCGSGWTLSMQYHWSFFFQQEVCIPLPHQCSSPGRNCTPMSTYSNCPRRIITLLSWQGDVQILHTGIGHCINNPYSGRSEKCNLRFTVTHVTPTCYRLRIRQKCES